jgi:hypothetical protein
MKSQKQVPVIKGDLQMRNGSSNNDPVRLIAFYLPQFYPIPENDEWWGKGFTEWTNVTMAKPLFNDHYQPHIPADLGFYDLRSPLVREEQAQIARQYGIFGFCYYHYWSKGKMILEKPMEEVLAFNKPEFPFCLCWGNHNWTRRWDGQDQEVLWKQEYSFEDDLEHINYLIPFFKDHRYIKIHGRPLFGVYIPEALPDPEKTARIWRKAVKRAGFPDLYLVNIENSFQREAIRLGKGFDATVEFGPDSRCVETYIFTNYRNTPLFINDESKTGFRENAVYLYDTVTRKMILKEDVPYKRFRCVFPSWDNSPRRMKVKEAWICHGSTPEKYREFLERIILYTWRKFREEERLVFINAWNEWGEGCHLEPDMKFGRKYLEATWEALQNTSDIVKNRRKNFADKKFIFLTETVRDFEQKYMRSSVLSHPVNRENAAQLYIDAGQLAIKVVPYSDNHYFGESQKEWGDAVFIEVRSKLPGQGNCIIELEAKERQLEAFRNSWSWRITGPLRKIHAALFSKKMKKQRNK